MRIHGYMPAIVLVVTAATLVAQNTPKCPAADTATRPLRPLFIVNGQIVSDSVPITADVGGRFLSHGPGQAFGISGYRCAACQDKYVPGHALEFIFMSEPVVVSIDTATPVQVGDIIEAVNSQPITTSSGAAQFASPPPGPNTLTVRRGRDRLILNFTLPLWCKSYQLSFNANDTTRQMNETVRQLSGLVKELKVATTPGSTPVPRTIHIRGTSQVASGPIYVIDGVRIEPSAAPPSTRYGFAISCDRGCAKVTNPDGATFYRFAAPPTINAIRDTSVAVSAGLNIGDVIVKVDGLSILTDEASIRLTQPDRTQTLRLTVVRDGREIAVSLRSAK